MYVRMYDIVGDFFWQCEVNLAAATKARADGCAVSDQPFEGVRILPRLRSEWPEDICGAA